MHTDLEIRHKLPIGQQEAEISERASKPTAMRKDYLPAEDLKDFAALLEGTRSQLKESAGDLEADYETRLATVRTELRQSMQDPSSLPALKTAMQLKAKYAVLDLFFGKLLGLKQNPEEESLWRILKNGQDQVVEGLLRLVLGAQPETEQNVGVWKSKYMKAQKDMSEVLSASQRLQEEARRLRKEKDDIKEHWAREKSDMAAQISALEADNRKYLGTIVRQSKGLAGSGQKGSASPAGSLELVPGSVQDLKSVLSERG